MAGQIGRIDVLDPTLETWTSYKERFYSFFIELDIKDEKKFPHYCASWATERAHC